MSYPITKNFIEDAFIEPIRSVLIVDDEYPTLDGLLEGCESGINYWIDCSAKKKNNAKELLQFAEFCRAPGRGWLVDVHNGKNIDLEDEKPIIEFLRERDLLVLDYHLRDRDSSLSVQILHALAKSDNFNICIVYSEEAPELIFSEIVKGFISPKFDSLLDEGSWRRAKVAFENWDNEKPGIEKELTTLIDSIYLELWRIGDPSLKGAASSIVQSIKNIIEPKLQNLRISGQLLFSYLLQNYESGLKLSDGKISSISEMVRGPRWIRSDNLFVVMVQKTDGGGRHLLDKVTEALIAWEPTPVRLLLSKFRAAFDAGGARTSDYALANKAMHALWISELIKIPESLRPSAIAMVLSRHWELLFDVLTESVSDYTAGLIRHLEGVEDQSNLIFNLFGLDLSGREAEIEAKVGNNIYCCSKVATGIHLTTGHIIEWNKSLWVCLTPACDLVPGQKNRKAGETPIRFKAAKLHPYDRLEDALQAASGSAVFLRIGSKQYGLSIFKEKDKPGAPEWREFYASRQGRFDLPDRTFEIISSEWTVPQGGELENADFRSSKELVRVVGQLRYEYALNLLQILGANLSRVGVDFATLPKPARPKSVYFEY